MYWLYPWLNRIYITHRQLVFSHVTFDPAQLFRQISKISQFKNSIKWDGHWVYLSSSSLRSFSWIICTLIRLRGISMNHKRFWKIAGTFTEEEEEAKSEGIPILHDTKWAVWSTWVASQVILQTWWSGPTCTPRRFSVRGCVSKVLIMAITSINSQKYRQRITLLTTQNISILRITRIVS